VFDYVRLSSIVERKIELNRELKEKWRHILKNATRVEVISAISTAVPIRNNKKSGSYIREVFYINCYNKFKPCGIFEDMTSFLPILKQDLEQGKLKAAVNSRKERSKNCDF